MSSRPFRVAVLSAIGALALVAPSATPTHAQRCNPDAGCSNGVRPNYWLPSGGEIGRGKATGYILLNGNWTYVEYNWYDFVRPGGGVDRYCGFGGQQITCPK